MFRVIVLLVCLAGGWQEGFTQVDSLGRSTDTLPSFARTDMDEVVVSANLRPVRKMESPVAVEVYGQYFLKKNPVPSLFEALQLVNGVRPQLNCNVCNTGDIHINGLEGPYTMVTIDGMPIVSGLSTVYGLFGIPNDMIERIEIVKGPASGLYGSEAVGGLINIITRSALTAPKFSADVMATSWKELQADFSGSLRTGKVHTLIGAHMFRYDQPIDHNQDGFTDLTLQERYSVFSKWRFERKAQRIAEMGWRYYTENRWGGQMNWRKEFLGSDSIYGESIATKRWEWIGKYQLPVSLPFIFSWSYTRHHQDSYYGTTPFLADQQIGFAQLTWTKKTERHDWLAGAAFRYSFLDDNTIVTTDALTGRNKPDRQQIPGFFLQHEWKPAARHKTLSGIRYDHHQQHGSIVTPRLAWKWSPSASTAWRLNTGTGFRVVSIFTEDHAALTGARKVEILEKIRPERSWNINLNVQQRWMFQNSQLNLDASLWHTRFSNRILPDYDTDPDKIFYRNLDGHSVSQGFSMALDWNLAGRFKGMVGATLQDVFQQSDGERRIRPVLTEKWSSVWNLTYVWENPSLTIDYTGNIYGPMRLPLLGPLDPRPGFSPVWSLQNLQLTWKHQRMEWYGGVKNLLNWTPSKDIPFLIARAHDPFDKQVRMDAEGKILRTAENPCALSFDPTYSYAPNQGRRIFIGFRYRLTKKMT